MLKAIVNNKCSNYEYSEDCLTSTVFGAFRYLDIHKGILSFFKNAVLHSDSNKSIEDDLNSKGVEINNYTDLKCYFWPRTREFDEPDIICVFTDKNEREDDLVFLVECKFKSSKSGTGDRDQLMRYYDDLHNKINHFYDQDLSKLKTSLRYLIYLTQFEARKEINESIKQIEKNIECNSNSIDIFSLNWYELSNILSQYKNSVISTVEYTIIEDLVEYLEAVGLLPFKGFSVNKMKSIKKDYIFFNELETYFSKAIDVEYKNIIFYGGK